MPTPLLPLVRACGAALLLLPTLRLSAHEPSLPERLGYPADAKLLIIHADDLGLAHSKNVATFEAMEHGVVSSASVMMPTPWVLEVVDLAKAHPEADLGVHVTLTAEWKHYKWGPLAGSAEVPSLVTKEGVFHDNVADFAAAARLDEVEKEVRLQVERAKELGLDVTHLDGHMGVLNATEDLMALYVRIGNDYGVPVRLHHHAGDEAEDPQVRAALQDYPARLDAIYGAPPETYPDGMIDYYNDVLRNLKPGLSMLVLHLSYDDPEMQAITVEHPHWGARWRQIDYDWATSPETRRILKEEGIILLTNREIRDKLFGPAAADAKQE